MAFLVRLQSGCLGPREAIWVPFPSGCQYFSTTRISEVRIPSHYPRTTSSPPCLPFWLHHDMSVACPIVAHSNWHSSCAHHLLLLALCLSPPFVCSSGIEIWRPQAPSRQQRWVKREHLSDNCSDPAIVRSSAHYCCFFGSNSDSLIGFVCWGMKNISYLVCWQAQVDELGGFNPL